MYDRATFKRFVMEYNGKSNPEFGVEIISRPDIPSPEKNVTFITVAGRDTNLTESDGNYNDIVIPVRMNYIAEPRQWNNKKRALVNWLRPSGILSFSDDQDFFYKVKQITFQEITRTYKRGGGIVPNFTCDPFVYFYSGSIPQTFSGSAITIVNPGLRSKPLYNIIGNGSCTMTVNGNLIKAEVGQNIFIDTERLIAYKDGKIIQNTQVTGDYDGPIDLLPGVNKITISSGFTLKVTPNWRVLA